MKHVHWLGTGLSSIPGIRRLAERLENFTVWNRTLSKAQSSIDHINKPITVSIIGCVVNGPGEARETDIGLTGGGKGTHQIYLGGLPNHRLKDEGIITHIVGLVEKKAQEIEAELVVKKDKKLKISSITR